MDIISWNVNGIRSVYGKGFVDFVHSSGADIICVQELKAHEEDIPLLLKELAGYASYFNCAQKKGYSGVGVFTRHKPDIVVKTFGDDRFDSEGRMLELHFPDLTLINFYIPNGGRDKRDMDYKLHMYDGLFTYLTQFVNSKTIIIGDFNIAHTALDLARPKENEKNTMFTPEEREKLERLIDIGFIDTFRQFEKGGGHYTWWPYFYNARARNLGWRIDYAFVTEKLLPLITESTILPHIMGSDHCPIKIEIR